MSEERQKHSHFKMILAILLLAGIAGLLVYSNAGMPFPQGLSLGMFTSIQPSSGEPFGIILSTGATSLYGNDFKIDKSAVSVNGICNLIKINDITIEKDNAKCDIVVGNFSGTFQYTEFGSIVFMGTSDSLILNSDKYSSSAPVSFDVEIIPVGFSVNGITSKRLSFVAPSGSIQKFGSEGSLKAISYLSNTTLDISNLIGRVELSTDELKVTGTATSVKGDEFDW